MQVNTNTRRLTLRSASDGQLIVPRTKTEADERAFVWQAHVHGTAYH